MKSATIAAIGELGYVCHPGPLHRGGSVSSKAVNIGDCVVRWVEK